MSFSVRYRLSKKDLRQLREEVSATLPGAPMTWNNVELAKSGDYVVYFDDGLPCLARVGGRLIPTLVCLLKRGYGWLPQVLVDRGASQAVGRGADLMVPGIRGVEGAFSEGQLVVIVDEAARVPVGVGLALMDDTKMRAMAAAKAKGKAVQVIHYPGDKLWKLIA